MNKLKNLLHVELDENLFLQLYPQWTGAKLKITQLTGGITNKLYRIQSEKGDLVLRIYGEKTELFINNMADLDIAPKLVKYMPEKGVTIVEYITGSYTLKNEDFLNTNLHEKITNPIRRIHQSDVVFPKIFNPMIEVIKMAKILSDLNVDYPEFEIKPTIRSLENLNQEINIPENDYTPCHNDLLADNFILIQDKNQTRFKQSMYIIDWEYAGMAPKYYDIADMFQEILVPRQVEKSLVEHYCQFTEVDKHIYLIDMFKPFPDIYWFLWSLIQQNVSKIKFDFYTYGKVKYENAQKNLQYLRENYDARI